VASAASFRGLVVLIRANKNNQWQMDSPITGLEVDLDAFSTLLWLLVAVLLVDVYLFAAI
jgi:hypothetical protein